MRPLTPHRRRTLWIAACAVVLFLLLAFCLGPWSMVRLLTLHDLETGRTSALTEPDEFDRWEQKWSDPSRLTPQALRHMAAGTTHPDWSPLVDCKGSVNGDGSVRTWLIDARLTLSRTTDPETGSGRFLLTDAQTGDSMDLSGGVSRDAFDRFIAAHTDW